MGLAGAAALRQFVERGGLLITEGGTTNLIVALGFNPTVQRVEPEERCVRRGRCCVHKARPSDSPVLYGYEDAPSIPGVLRRIPVLSVQPRDTLAINVGVDSAILREAEARRARVILRYYPARGFPVAVRTAGLWW